MHRMYNRSLIKKVLVETYEYEQEDETRGMVVLAHKIRGRLHLHISAYKESLVRTNIIPKVGITFEEFEKEYDKIKE